MFIFPIDYFYIFKAKLNKKKKEEKIKKNLKCKFIVSLILILNI